MSVNELPSHRALWVWERVDSRRVVDLAVARGIGRLFVAVPRDLLTSPALGHYVELVAAAAAAGIDVDALGGAPEWIDDHDDTTERWLTPVVESGLFAGAHLDVEPHGHPAWNASQPTVVARYLGLLAALRAAAPGFRLEADIGVWFHEVAAGREPLDRSVMRLVDAVTILAYRNTAAGPDGTIDLARPEVRTAQRLGRPVRIGQETRYLGPAPACRKQTFHGSSPRPMEQQFTAIESAFADVTTFAGLAIHDERGYRTIVEA